MQQTRNERLWLLPALALCVFGVMVALLLRVVPGPHAELDYVVIGTVSIMVALFVVFLVWMKTGTSATIHVKISTNTKPASSPLSILGDLSGDKV